MSKRVRDVICEYNELREFLNKIITTGVENISKEERPVVDSKTAKLKELKNEIKTLEKEEHFKVRLDVDGFAEMPDIADHIINPDDKFFDNAVRSDGTQFNGGNQMVDSKFKILNISNISKIYENKEGLDLGNYVKGALTGQWDNASKEMDQFKALSTGTGAVLIPQSLSAQVLAAVMNKSLIYRSGCPVVDMPNGNLTIARVVNNPTYGFKEELAPVAPSDTTFEGINLKGKTCYGLMKVSLETLHSATNLTQVLLQAMSDSIADAIDKAMLYGTGITDIKGIFNYDTINTVEATKIDYSSFVNAVGKIRQANGEPTIMGVNATVDNALNLLVDTLGQPLEAPKVIDNLQRTVSNNLRSNLGPLLDENEAIIYDPSALIIGNQVRFAFEVSRELGFTDGSVYLRIYSLLDMAVIRPEFITHITKLK